MVEMWDPPHYSPNMIAGYIFESQNIPDFYSGMASIKGSGF
jgi:hypothetical protein